MACLRAGFDFKIFVDKGAGEDAGAPSTWWPCLRAGFDFKIFVGKGAGGDACAASTGIYFTALLTLKVTSSDLTLRPPLR